MRWTMGLVAGSVVLAGCASFAAPPAASIYSKVSPTAVSTAVKRAYVPPRVDDLDGADVELHTVPEEDEDSSWRMQYGHMDSHYVTRGGQQVQVVAPDRVRADWVDEFDYQDRFTCPLVLSFDDAPVRFEASRVDFDWGGEQTCSGTDWPTAATPWLALDRDDDGGIDGGHELFGTGTPIDGRFAEHGFEALAQLDADGNGEITPADPAWDRLRLWADADGDRRSSPDELRSLEEAGLVRLQLDYARGFDCGDRGNCEGERASVGVVDGRSARVIDVYLRCR